MPRNRKRTHPDGTRTPGELHKFQKSQTERIHAAIYRFRGEWRIDVRTFFLTRQGPYYRTRRGVSFPLELLPELEKAVRMIRTAADDLDTQRTAAESAIPPLRPLKEISSTT